MLKSEMRSANPDSRSRESAPHSSRQVKDAGYEMEQQQHRVSNARKTAIVERKLAKWNIGIAALQKTRIAANCSLKA
ncbi:hypothetical protein ElyMa_000338900 [Elysia marginata]|uniref:Uncharacterized protein n=1 Tax=Elysia marginata TaxID=1093978 RepID=A0AAV4FCG4_9GAST|nr:hypothetical protein ElyMa_000338900 [Elysia marginata]